MFPNILFIDPTAELKGVTWRDIDPNAPFIQLIGRKYGFVFGQRVDQSDEFADTVNNPNNCEFLTPNPEFKTTLR
jgi:hypothetical protein